MRFLLISLVDRSVKRAVVWQDTGDILGTEALHLAKWSPQGTFDEPDNLIPRIRQLIAMQRHDG